MNWLRTLLISLCICGTSPGSANAADISASKVKAAFILNFAKFTRWPGQSDTDTNLSLCVIGSNVLDGEIQGLQHKKAGKYTIEIRYYDSGSLPDPKQCQLAFIGSSESKQLSPLLKTLANQPVLTISDIQNFAQQGGAIELLLQQQNIVFQVNLTTLQKSQLKLPGQVLNLATQVIRQ